MDCEYLNDSRRAKKLFKKVNIDDKKTSRMLLLIRQFLQFVKR